MHKFSWPLTILVILTLALPAWAGGPYNIRPPAAGSGIVDPHVSAARKTVTRGRRKTIQTGEKFVRFAFDGHDYVLEIGVCGPLDEVSGRVVVVGFLYWFVQHPDLHIGVSARLHAVSHGVKIRVVAAAHVLNVGQ